MQTILRIVVVLFVTVGGEGLPAAQADQPDPKRVILSLATPGLSEAARSSFGQNLLRGLAFGGHDVRAEDFAGPAAATDLLALCADADCVRRIGQIRGAGYLVKASIDAVQAANSKTTYRMKMEAFAASTGRPVVEKHTACDACDENLAAHLGYLLATEISRGIADVRRQRDFRPQSVLAAQAPPAGSSRTASATASALSLPAPPEAEHRSGARSALPWIAIGAGILAMATSAILIRKDGEGTCTLTATDHQCPDVYNTKTQGILWGVGGVAIAGLGLWDLVSAKNEAAPLHAHVRFGSGLGLQPGLGTLSVRGAF
jgi:hypothetical protein